MWSPRVHRLVAIQVLQWRIQSWSRGGGGVPSPKFKWLVKVGASVIRVDLKKSWPGVSGQPDPLDTPLCYVTLVSLKLDHHPPLVSPNANNTEPYTSDRNDFPRKSLHPTLICVT